MIALKTITLKKENYIDNYQQKALYLILSDTGFQFFTRTVEPINHVYSWSIPVQEMRIDFGQKDIELQIEIIDYDTCGKNGVAKFTINKTDVSSENYTCKQTIKMINGENISLQIQFENHQSKQLKSNENIGTISRNSKKTKTTCHEDNIFAPILEKVSSLKHIIQKQWYPASPTHTPKKFSQLAYLRSYRENLQRKLYTSIELQAKAMKRYIV